MISKSDLQHANEQLKAEARRELGEPSNEELLAFSRGELPADRAARVTKQLIAYPELARALAVPFPSLDEAEPLPDEELDRRWAEMKSRIAVVPMRPSRGVTFWRTLAAAATLAAAVLGGLLVKTQSDARRLERELSEPRALSIEAFTVPPDTRRGAEEAPPFMAGDSSLLLVVPLLNAPRFPAYRIVIADASGRVAWSGEAPRREDDTFHILVPPRAFGAGPYQIVVEGVDGGRRERLATYSFSLR